MTDWVFGRKIEFDERSRSFPIRAALTPEQLIKPRSYTWSCPVVLDQGQEGSCTGHGVAHEAAARPVKVPGITHEIAVQIYKRAQQLDIWPGEDYDGSSVLAAMKAGKERGWYAQYRWAFSEEDLALAVGYKGPAVIGVNWYEGMCGPDTQGLIQVTGNVYGGHCVLVNGINIKKSLYRIHNSWGMKWGINGECFISRSDMKRLLQEDGEACIPVVRKLG